MSFGKILNFMIIHAVIRGNNITIICMNDFETLILRLIASRILVDKKGEFSYLHRLNGLMLRTLWMNSQELEE